jgi:VWFA-related protein
MVRCAIAGILIAAVTMSFAQVSDDRGYKLAVDVELVQLPVSVLDKRGLSIPGLRQEHFSVYEDKIQQDISLFVQEDVPLSIVLLIDSSGSMLQKLDALQTGAMTFVKGSNPEDETSIVSFGKDAMIEQDFTGNTSELRRALRRIRPNGDTALYDAVILSAKYLESNANYEKKVLLVISDGEDNKSAYKLRDALRAVSESKVTVYTIGLLTPGYPQYVLLGDTAKKALKQLADVSGGASFFPTQMSDVESICATIAHNLRNQYTIGYRPSNRNLDGSWRKVSVRLSPPKNTGRVKVRTKQGYYAPVRTDQARKQNVK